MKNKALLIYICSLTFTLTSLGQGTVIFDNRNVTTGPAPVMNSSGFPASGTNFSAQLYSAGGNQLNNLGALTAAENRGAFRGGLGAGFVQFSGTNPFTSQPVDQEITVTSVQNGPATIQLRAWDSRYSTYEQAVDAGAQHGSSPAIFLAVTGGGLLPAVELTGLQGFTMVPEPSVLGLGALAIGLFFCRLRRL